MSKVRPILVIDAPASRAPRIDADLSRSGYEAVHVSCATSDILPTALVASHWEAILLGAEPPGDALLMSLSTIRMIGTETPIVTLVAARDEELGIRTVGIGACDYVIVEQPGRLTTVLDREIRNAASRREGRSTSHVNERVLSVVAHDLRNPLSVIQLASVALLEDLAAGLTGELGDSVRVIQRSCLHAQWLVADLLDAASIARGQVRLVRQPVDPSALVCELAENQRGIVAAAQLDLVVELDDRTSVVWADPGRLMQVLENLVSNAVKFTRCRGRVAVGVESRDRIVVFRVCDNGAGITKEDLPHVFEPYWQAQSLDYRGIGLGLPIAKRIVEAHGGSMWVESQSGVGTGVYFSLPAFS